MVLAAPPPPQRVGHADHFDNIISRQNVAAIGRTAEKKEFSREIRVRAYDIWESRKPVCQHYGAEDQTKQPEICLQVAVSEIGIANSCPQRSATKIHDNTSTRTKLVYDNTKLKA
jgi:hypothetical protein